MSRIQLTRTVASWEFRRYFKWKDQLLALIFFIVVSVIGYGVAQVAQSKGRTMTVALADLALEAPETARVRFVPVPEDGAVRDEALRKGEIHGVLSRRDDGGFDLLVLKDPRYKQDLVAILAAHVQRERLIASGISAQDLALLLTPPALEVHFTDLDVAQRGRSEKIAAVVFIVILLLAVFNSLAYLFTGITGEKQLRVTELVISAISPQVWIDGKILGIALHSLAASGTVVVGFLLVALAANLGWAFEIPAAAVRPTVLLTLGVFCVLGILLWNSFFAAVASTVDDPNTSSRSSLLMLPMLPVVLSLAVLRDPDGFVARFLALCPLTSAPALPIRLVLSDPGPIEIAASAVLLASTIWLMRRLAGRIFEIGMLLYGKEPTLREIARWVSKPGSIA